MRTIDTSMVQKWSLAMQYKHIDMNTYPRKNHFEYFRKLAYPYTGLTAEIDVTRIKQYTQKKRYSFFLTMTHLVARAANRIPEFRRRIQENGIIEYPDCGTSHTLLLPDNTYCYCTLYHNLEFDEYIRYAVAEQEKSRQNASIEDDEETDALYFVSAIPWVHYTDLVQAVPCSQESNPRISFGKYEDENGKLMMPLSVLVHHALMDGYHLGLFYQYVVEEMNSLTADGSIGQRPMEI